MKFKIDENLPVEVVDLLRDAGYDTMSVIEQGLGGNTDNTIALVCKQEQRTIITLDVDFANINTYPPSQYHGILVLRLGKQSKPHVIETIKRLLPMLSKEPVDKQLWIVEEDRIRVRE